MSIALSLFTLASATHAVVACPVGTRLQLHQTRERRLASRSWIKEPRLRYVETRTIRPVNVRCAVRLSAFDPNSSGARTSSSDYIWFQDWSIPATIVGSPIFSTSGGEARPMIGLDMARSCNPASVASTTFGPFSSCISLTRDGSGTTLEIASKVTGGESSLTAVPLPYSVHYVGLSAGSWAHDVGGDIALIRAEDDGSAVLDIYALLAN